MKSTVSPTHTPPPTHTTTGTHTHLIPEELGDVRAVGGLDEVDGLSHTPVQGVLVQRQGAAGRGQGEGGAGQGQRGGGAGHRQRGVGVAGQGARRGLLLMRPPDGHRLGSRRQHLGAGRPREPLGFVHLQDTARGGGERMK